MSYTARRKQEIKRRELLHGDKRKQETKEINRPCYFIRKDGTRVRVVED